MNSSEQRGQQLANYINGLGHSKVNIMAHSQGAPTSRVTASLIPHKVASVTSINGVNKGSKVADVARESFHPAAMSKVEPAPLPTRLAIWSTHCLAPTTHRMVLPLWKL